MYYYRVYDADYGQAAYDNQRLNCGRRPKWADSDAFIDWADDKMLNDQWPADAVIGKKSQDDAVLLTLIEKMTLFEGLF